MTEEKNCEKSQTKVELQIIPCATKALPDHEAARPMNHETQDDPCQGKVILTVTCDGSKLTKADSVRFNELQQELFITVRFTGLAEGKLPNIDVSVQEKSNVKMAKADICKA